VNIKPKVRDLFYSFVTVAALIALAACLAVFTAGSVKIRLLASVGGAVLCFFGAMLSRNPRLFCLWGLGFSIPFLFAKTFGTVINKGGGEVAFNVDVTDIFLVVLCAFLARDFFYGRRKYIRVPAVSYFWIAIMLFGVFVLIAGPYRRTAAHEVFRMVKMLILFLVLCQELETPRRILHWCGALTLGLLVNAITGLVQSYYRITLGLADLGEPSAEVTKTLAATSINGTEVWRVGAFLIHPNIFGIFLAAVLPLTIACFLLRGGKLKRLWFLATFLLGMGALVATESRSGWISFAAALACFLFLSLCHVGLHRRSRIAAVVIAVLVLGMVVVERGPILRRILNSKEAAYQFRGVFNEDAKRMIAEKPLWGFGLNSYALNISQFASIRYGSWPPPVHHIYYLWWAETGLIGLGIHLALWGGIVWKGIRNLRVKDERMFVLNAACLAGMLAFALDGFVSFSLRITPTLKTFWALAAIIMAVYYWRLRWEVHQPAAAVESRPHSLPPSADEVLAPSPRPV
jgi:putative inorganic carbon (hco3(-)) transporter